MLVKATLHLCAHGYYYGIYAQHVSASDAHRYQELLVCPRVYLCHPQPEDSRAFIYLFRRR